MGDGKDLKADLEQNFFRLWAEKKFIDACVLMKSTWDATRQVPLKKNLIESTPKGQTRSYWDMIFTNMQDADGLTADEYRLALSALVDLSEHERCPGSIKQSIQGMSSAFDRGERAHLERNEFQTAATVYYSSIIVRIYNRPDEKANTALVESLATLRHEVLSSLLGKLCQFYASDAVVLNDEIVGRIAKLGRVVAAPLLGILIGRLSQVKAEIQQNERKKVYERRQDSAIPYVPNSVTRLFHLPLPNWLGGTIYTADSATYASLGMKGNDLAQQRDDLSRYIGIITTNTDLKEAAFQGSGTKSVSLLEIVAPDAAPVATATSPALRLSVDSSAAASAAGAAAGEPQPESDETDKKATKLK